MFCRWISPRQFIPLPSSAGLTLSGPPRCLHRSTHFKQESWHRLCHRAERYTCDFSAFLLQTIPSVSSPPDPPTKQGGKNNLWSDWKKWKGGWWDREREREKDRERQLTHKSWKLRKIKNNEHSSDAQRHQLFCLILFVQWDNVIPTGCEKCRKVTEG